MQAEMQTLMLAAVSIACLHTISGPDHYLPFIVLSKSKQWTVGKTMGWTVICGFGHVFSSVMLALGGAAIGWSLSKLSWIEQVRGGIAGWVMLIFGLGYIFWGIHRIYKNKSHKHFDQDKDGNLYVFEHRHGSIMTAGQRFRVTPWVIFIIFVLGPCEPMIPLLYFPAAQNSLFGMLLLIAVYTSCTLLCMLLMVLLGYYGIAISNTRNLERYIHVLGGATIFICGVGMLWMGW
jgi:hypothetical protein